MDLYEMRIDATNWLYTSGQAALDRTGDIFASYPGPIMIACAVVGSGIMAYAVTRWKEKQRPIGEIEAMKRRAILDQKYADRFGDALFEMLMKDEIDRHEYKRACRRFGIAYRLHDLLVRKNSKRGMKFRVKHNCQVMHDTTPSLVGKALGPRPGNGAPPPLPVVIRAQKVWVVRGKAMLRLKSAE